MSPTIINSLPSAYYVTKRSGKPLCTHVNADRKADIYTNRLTDRQTDRQSERERERERERELFGVICEKLSAQANKSPGYFYSLK